MPNNIGVNVLNRSSVTAQAPAQRTDTAFIAAITPMGRTDQPVKVTSLAQYILNFGNRSSWDTAYDWLDAFFNEANGGQVYVQRIIHAAGATVDSHTFNDSGAAASITVSSIGPATSGLSAAIQSGQTPGSYNIVVTGLPDGSSVTSPDLLTVQDAVNWGATQLLFRVTAAGANPPANVAAQALSGGADNHGAIVDADKVAALALIPPGLGPGQVAVPGATTETVQGALLAHAAANNRFALVDTADTASSSTLLAAAAAIQADAGLSTAAKESGVVLCDWQIIPGIVFGTTRSVPPSAIAAALIARSDRASGGNQNLAPCGVNGLVQYALGKTQADWSDTVGTTLVQAGVNPFRLVYGGQRLYGFRTLANPNTDPVWVMGTASRLRMAIVDKGKQIAQSVFGGEIDGQGHEQAQYGGMIGNMLNAYFQMGALYGNVATDAYVVDTGADVNTPMTIANRELHAAIGIRPSPFAEMVFFELAGYPVTQPV